MYRVELSVSTTYIEEDDEETDVNVCAVLTGRYDSLAQDVSVTLSFMDSQSAGITDNKRI